MKAAVIGAAGFVGGELLRLVLRHPEITEVIATSRSQAGKPISAVHPGIAGLSLARFSGLTADEAAQGMDVVFLALEHGESSKVAAAVLDSGPGLVIDLAADFRIRDGRIHERYYGLHPAAELVHLFQYGLADVCHAELVGARAIAAPGCFATAAQLALFPLRELELLSPPALFAVTGSSGAGIHPKSTTHHPLRAHNLFAYSPMGHRHEGEILEQWGRWTGNPAASARLMVHAGPFVRGIYLTAHAVLKEPRTEVGWGEQLLKTNYHGRPFVEILDQPPELTHAVGTNVALMHATASPDGRELQVMVAIDNLIKGAGGQALQAMNLAMGIPETVGLIDGSPFPI